MKTVVAALALSLLPLAPAAAAPRPQLHPVGGFGAAVHNFLFSPGAVEGANDWSCRPSERHRTPVVLVHGTFGNLGMNWARLAPVLANEGYCVYAFNYGMIPLSAQRLGGLGDITRSAGELKRFVARVLKETGAKKVDVVGHSQGGMMPNYYIKRLGGAKKVRRLVALAPSNHGTTQNGLSELVDALRLRGFASTTLDVTGLPAIEQQLAGSDFQKELFADGDTVKGVSYVVIATKYDEAVTPYTRSFLEGARNILLQDQCPDSTVDHVMLAYDGPAIDNVVNALGPNDPDFKPEC